MRCRYCFYCDLAQIREVTNYGYMSHDLLECLVAKALAETREHCQFGFQGGEPTLAGLDFFRVLIELEKKYNVNQVKISHALQTNGLTLDEQWAEFFRENNFLIGLSIDGSQENHDNLRPDATGKNTHARCLRAARVLAKHEVAFNILSVVTRHLAAHPDKTYRFYKKHNFRYIQFIPCLDGLQQPPGTNQYSLSDDLYGRFLCRIFDLWYADLLKDEYYSIRMFDNYVQMLTGRAPENCAMNGVCSAYALVEADGSVYPCDFYAVDSFRLGNVASDSFEAMLNGDRAEAFIAPSRYVDPACRTCPYYPLCRGGCRRDREPLQGESLSLNRYCQSYQTFFRHALPRMQSIARCQ